MRTNVPVRNPYCWLALIVGAVIALMPFHAFLTVWLSQSLGHYTILRLWKEALLAALGCGCLYMLIRDASLRRQFFSSWLNRFIIAFLVLQMLWGAGGYALNTVALKALGYGLISNMRYGIFFLVVWLIAARVLPLKRRWQRLVLWPLAVVILVGLLQYFVLPYDALKHVGYSATTIFPYEDINSNLRYIRIMSTLRGANPLGAYLAAILCVVLSMRRLRSWWWYGLLAGGIVALVLTFSRSAWIGFAGGVVLLAISYIPFRKWRWQLGVGAGMAIIILGGIILFAYRSPALQNVLLHTEAHSTVKTTSNEGHVSALRQGLRDVVREPFGHGVGTAGPASIYNIGHSARIAENYYVQMAQETGWVGLVLFLAVQVAIGVSLWRQRRNVLSLGLCAGLVSVSIIGLFSHVWADDTLAYVWWGLAGLALSPAILQTKAEQTHGLPKAIS